MLDHFVKYVLLESEKLNTVVIQAPQRTQFCTISIYFANYNQVSLKTFLNIVLLLLFLQAEALRPIYSHAERLLNRSVSLYAWNNMNTDDWILY
jgi:hypothetical protein